MIQKKEQKKLGRKKIALDWEQIGKLIFNGANGMQVAAVIGVHKDTLYNRCLDETGNDFSAFSAIHKEKGNSALLNKQIEVALNGNITMMIWLGKQRLGQKEDPKTGNDFDAELKGYIDYLKKKYTDQRQENGDSK